MRTQRTCDRCYKIKSQCIFEPPAKACIRCARLGHACETKRAVLQPGRPRRSSAPARETTPRQASSPPDHRLVPLGRSPPVLRGFTDHEVSLVEFTLHPDQISSLIYGQTFQDVMRTTLATRLVFATDQLKDGFLAFALALSHNKKAALIAPGGIAPAQRGAKALQILGSLENSSFEDARTSLVLALALITYNDLLAGAPALPITRSALLRAAPWRHQLIGMTTEETEPSLICLLFNEMFECIVLGQAPVFRYEPPSGNRIIDRYYGICHELLPHLYDVCMLYISVKNGLSLTNDTTARMKELAVVIDQWNPESIIEERQEIIKDEAEKQHFLLQARCFKSTIQLLILQAQRSALTDMLASSKAMQLESEVFYTTDVGSGRPNYLLFPYFTCCVELHGTSGEEPKDILDHMHKISNGIAPKSSESMLAALKHIWHNQRRRPYLTWFECVEDGLMLAMGP